MTQKNVCNLIWDAVLQNQRTYSDFAKLITYFAQNFKVSFRNFCDFSRIFTKSKFHVLTSNRAPPSPAPLVIPV